MKIFNPSPSSSHHVRRASAVLLIYIPPHLVVPATRREKKTKQTGPGPQRGSFRPLITIVITRVPYAFQSYSFSPERPTSSNRLFSFLLHRGTVIWITDWLRLRREREKQKKNNNKKTCFWERERKKRRAERFWPHPTAVLDKTWRKAKTRRKSPETRRKLRHWGRVGGSKPFLLAIFAFFFLGCCFCCCRESVEKIPTGDKNHVFLALSVSVEGSNFLDKLQTQKKIHSVSCRRYKLLN